jgi:aspartate/methionine/tyrosine aminotransferase
MYMMVRIDIEHFEDVSDDKDFCLKLLAEQNAFCFPSSCFFEKNMFRAVICTKPSTLLEFGDRLEAFCLAHAKK